MTVMEVLAELQLPANVEHVRDVKEIGRMGIMGTPALIIGDTVKAVGSVPTKTKIMEWLKQALKKN
jgi:protein-disulfide isomerase